MDASKNVSGSPFNILHFTLGKFLVDFASDNNKKTSKFFRIYNEIPTIILIVVIFIVIFKPI